MKQKLLLVDHDQGMREVLEKALKEKYHVVLAGTLGEARAKLMEEEPSRLVTEISLPDGSGLDLIDMWNKEKEFVFVISGEVTPATLEEIKKRGVSSVMKKPIFPAKLLKALEEAEEKWRKREAILVVDDHAPTLEALSCGLERLGFSVDTAENGREALRKLEEKEYRLVFLDIHMPEMNGIETVREIKKRKPDTFVVIMTGEATRDEVKDALSFSPGHDGVLRKPISLETLSVLVNNLLREAEEKREPEEKEMLPPPASPPSFWERKGKAWTIVVLLSLLIGTLAYFSSEAIQKQTGSFFSQLTDFMRRVEGYLYRDEQRELEQKKE